jgi:nitroimidazol reductase NimA-like FMN-containing flavoprotein (pyridoxamine 5'-phosphate oxidase superfamily)
VPDFGVEYRSVVIFGTAELVGEAEASRALQMLMEKYAPHLKYGVDYAPFETDCPRKAVVYRINIQHWSGKKNEAPEDQPGAYRFPPPKCSD